ncbi:MAG: hypothetical protein KQJ78_09345 [Deltaproteobacteria bacterium]|nr:hypothetical protein [Deltaproteobacteria bacterium]
MAGINGYPDVATGSQMAALTNSLSSADLAGSLITRTMEELQETGAAAQNLATEPPSVAALTGKGQKIDIMV